MYLPMKHIICSILLSSSLLSPGETPIKAELLTPTDPIVLDAKNKALLVEITAALKEKQTIVASWEKDPTGKRDFTRLLKLDTIIAKGTQLKQGITLTLRLTNTSEEAITINYGEDTSTNTLIIDGPGALNLKFNGMMTADYRMGAPTKIAPGKSMEFSVTELRYDKRDFSRWLLTKAGEYAIQLKFITHVDRKKLEVTTNKITLKVKE